MVIESPSTTDDGERMANVADIDDKFHDDNIVSPKGYKQRGTKASCRWSHSPLVSATPSTASLTPTSTSSLSTSTPLSLSTPRKTFLFSSAKSSEGVRKVSTSSHSPVHEDLSSSSETIYEESEIQEAKNVHLADINTPDVKWRVRALFQEMDTCQPKHEQNCSVSFNESCIETNQTESSFVDHRTSTTCEYKSSSPCLQPAPSAKADNFTRRARRRSHWRTGVPVMMESNRTGADHNDNREEKTCSELPATPEQKSRHRRASSWGPLARSDFDFAKATRQEILVTSTLLCRLRLNPLVWILCIAGLTTVCMLVRTNQSILVMQFDTPSDESLAPRLAGVAHSSSQLQSFQRPAGGLKGVLVQNVGMEQEDKTKKDESKLRKSTKKDVKHSQSGIKLPKALDRKDSNRILSEVGKFKFVLPLNWQNQRRTFDKQDPKIYHPSSRGSASTKTTKSNSKASPKRVLFLHESAKGKPKKREMILYPAEFTDNTQLYSVLDSDDEALKRMEIREPLDQGECKPMEEWQTTFHPSCNGVHEVGMDYFGEDKDDDIKLFGTKGFWRYAWRYDSYSGHSHMDSIDTVVLKTLKFQHNFEDAHFEHDRIDAIAMERLTASPHVVNIFGFCGHSVVTEYASGPRLGELADKSVKKPLKRLKIARDIANGLADVHGIDGDDHATFVHLDINPANVMTIDGTLKLNDFNIGIIRRWNTTSNKPCGFPAQYPNPQWRSPEEARSQNNLTEKVDIFSMGHIFFRLICGHEPWNKLEPGGKPSKTEINDKVKNGVLPHIPDTVLESTNKEVVAIREAMLKCYTFDPQKRPKAREIARFLQHNIDQMEVEQGKTSTTRI